MRSGTCCSSASTACTSTPADSFPGRASLVTGGSPTTTGLWYDDTYNRELSPPAQADGLGNPGGTCPGIMPHQYVRVNTIFEVVRSHGGLTAWTDKHPSYEWTNGPSGRGVDDF
jgi:hypothetical protein